MDFASQIAPFALSVLLIELTPGPNMAYLAALSAVHGTRAGLFCVVGIALGLGIVGAAAALGLATLITQSPLLWEILRWAGVGFLCWLAWRAWIDTATSPDARVNPGNAFLLRGLGTNLLNPKAVIFYVTIVPQFIRDGSPPMRQALVLTAISVGIATLIHLVIILLSARLKAKLGQRVDKKSVGRIFAIALVGVAIWFASSTVRRPVDPTLTMPAVDSPRDENGAMAHFSQSELL